MLRDRLTVEQRELLDEGAERVEVGYMLGASGVNPRFPGDMLSMASAMAGEGSQGIPCAHRRIGEGARFVRHWDAEGNNGHETSLDQLLDAHPDLLVEPGNPHLYLVQSETPSDDDERVLRDEELEDEANRILMGENFPMQEH